MSFRRRLQILATTAEFDHSKVLGRHLSVESGASDDQTTARESMEQARAQASWPNQGRRERAGDRQPSGDDKDLIPARGHGFQPHSIAA